MSFKAKLDRYIWNNLIAFDQVWNTIFGGDPDETISSRLGKITVHRPESCKFCVFICYLLHKIDPDHCIKVVEKDRGGREVIK
jgi:hypothetical protein